MRRSYSTAEQQPTQSPLENALGTGGGASLRENGRSSAAVNPIHVHQGTAPSSSLAASTPEGEEAVMNELLQNVRAMREELSQMKQDMESNRERNTAEQPKTCCGVM